MRSWTIACLVSCCALAGASAEEDRAVRLAETPALSPDGRTLVFAWRGDLWRVASTGGVARRLTTHPAREGDPVFSRDGRRLAFTSDRTGAPQVFVLDLAGDAPAGAPRQVTHHTEGTRAHDWWPGRDALLVAGPRDHHWRDAERFFLRRLDDDRAPVPLFDDEARAGRVSPDGRHVAFVRSGVAWWRKGYAGPRAARVWLYDTASRRFTRVTDHDRGERWPLWAPDGRGLYTVSQVDGTFNLRYRDLETGAERALTRFEDDGVAFPALSYDGSALVFRRGFDLYRLATEPGAEPERLDVRWGGDAAPEPEERVTHATATQVAFSDDGREIVFAAGGDLWVMDTELKEPVQVTSTPEEERDPVFAPDFGALVFVSDAGGRTDLWRAVRADPDRPWWRNRAFRFLRLTDDDDVERRPRFTPGGRIAFTAVRGDLWSMAPDGRDRRLHLRSWNEPDYAFSPDGRWLAWAVDDDDFNRDVWLQAADGSGAPFNLSCHPDREDEPRWSPDGRRLAFVGERAHDESDVHYVWLRKEDDDRSRRERVLEKALAKMKEREAGGGREKKDGDAAPVSVTIDFEGLRDRIRRVGIPNARERGLLWSPDSKRIAFRAEVGGTDGLWTVAPPDDDEPKLLARRAGEDARWLAEGDRIVWRLGGRPASVTAKGRAETYAFRVSHAFDAFARNRAIFDQAWRTMRDHWYDARLNGRDWDAVRAKYGPVAGRCRTGRELDAVVSMMLGELNGSHLGFGIEDEPARRMPDWRPVTRHLGARFDPLWPGPGLRVRDVVPGTPAAKEASRLHPGDVVLAVDGRRLGRRPDPGRVLAGPLDRDVPLRVRGEDGAERTVALRPTTYADVRRRLYDAWVEHNRARVDALSGGQLGYLHVRSMNWPSFERFEAELYRVGHGRKGLLIDVRDNGGGYTTDHLLTCLCQPVHAITVPRGGGPGYPQDRLVYARWSRPVVVLCNRNSFSNAEIFSHAIKTLGRGRIVGERTAGGVISTGGTRLMESAFLRLPFRGWFVLGTGEDMELNGCEPDVPVVARPEEVPAGPDRALEVAVATLAEDVDAYERRPRAPLRYRSGRR